MISVRAVFWHPVFYFPQALVSKNQAWIWETAVWATLMTMPKTTVNENRLFAGSKNYIRIAWDRPQVKSVTIAHGVEYSANVELRFRVLASNPTHALATFARRQRVTRVRRTLKLIAHSITVG